MNLQSLAASVATVATSVMLLGSPANATVQNILLSNGEDGCTATERQQEGTYCGDLFAMSEDFSNGEDGCTATERQQEGTYCGDLFALTLVNGQLAVI